MTFHIDLLPCYSCPVFDVDIVHPCCPGLAFSSGCRCCSFSDIFLQAGILFPYAEYTSLFTCAEYSSTVHLVIIIIIIIIDTFIKRHKCLGYRGAGGDVNQADCRNRKVFCISPSAVIKQFLFHRVESPGLN